MRWFRFSLRTLLTITTVVCVWLGMKINAAREQRQAVAALHQFGPIEYDDEVDPDSTKHIPRPDRGWIERLFGVDFFHDVVRVNLGGLPESGLDNSIPYLRRLPGLRCLVFQSPFDLREEDYRNLADLQTLDSLWLDQNDRAFLGPFNPDSDPAIKGLVHLARLPRLKTLYISGSSFSNKSVEVIATFPALRKLNFGAVPITDGCIEYLAKLPKDTEIVFGATGIHKEAHARLKELRPDLKVTP
jgi:hypothetical protein